MISNRISLLSLWICRAASSIVLLAMAGCVQPPLTAASGFPPVPASQARVWFYRENAPYDGIGTPYVRLNGAPVGVSENGAAFYRDVPPGHYHVTVDSIGSDFGQASDVDLAPGQEAYVKIVMLNNWFYTAGYRSDGAHTTFYAWLVPPDAARAEIWRSPFLGGGTVAAAPSR